jgi:deoxyribodipyrimidine photolyase-related protein
MVTLRIILGDQLSQNISSLSDFDSEQDHILMAEVMAEATYVPHHQKKLVFVFSAMRHFAAQLQAQNYQITYIKLEDPNNSQSLTTEVQRWCSAYSPSKIIITESGEYRVQEFIKSWQDLLHIPVEIRADNRFLCTLEEFMQWADGKKQLRMEFFYRQMRKKHQLLMTADGLPEGGSWNFDKENRKPPKKAMSFPNRLSFPADLLTQEVITMVKKRANHHFGDIEPFDYALNNIQAAETFKYFLEHCLANFGNYQDAMLMGEPFLYHSVISLYLNVGLLDPLDCCLKAQNAYQQQKAPLNAVEGFIRQILGWREFIRGIYWLKMPTYKQLNHLQVNRALPEFYWSAQTKMNCLHQVILQTRQNAYSHHIQRLMITGNFALLAGLDPQEVSNWYLAVYADAYEWVELPNTMGMALYADGGIVGSKPYAASGKYIKRMSNFCTDCQYDSQETIGEKACPFNFLYWYFLEKNQNLLASNPRMTNIYATLKRMDRSKIEIIQNQANNFLDNLNF